MSIDVKALFCDDIRQEANGKFILIGVYSGEMNVGSGPASLMISTWLQISGLSAGLHILRFSARKHVGSQRIELAKIEAELEVIEGSLPIAMPLQGLPMNVDSDCSISLSVSFDGTPEVLAGSLEVKARFADAPAL